MKKIKTLNEFYETIKKETITVVYFYTTWCPDCFVMRPILPKIETEYPEYQFVKMNRNTDIELAKHLNIFGIPSFIVFRNGDEIGRYVDKKRKSYEQVSKFLDSVKQ